MKPAHDNSLAEVLDLGSRLSTQLVTSGRRAWALLIIGFASLLVSAAANATTYANAATTFSWIDATAHTQVTKNSTPYAFKNLGGCGTSPPIIDDAISDQIPFGFNFTFGDRTFNSARIMSNGRIQLTSTTIPLDNATCGYGSPVTQLPIPDAGLAYTMRIYGNDLDPTWASDAAPNGYVTACNDGTTATNNPCFVSFASTGSSPNRQFVVTWQGVPEWASFSSATGAYNVQIILKENGEFIYQYGTDVPGPAAATAQIAWEVSTSDFDSVPAGYPVPNTAIRFFIPHPVVELLMEQANWTGGSGKVLDTSGNGANASAVGSTPPTPAPGGKVCRGASFTGAATQAIDTGLAVPAVIGNTGTIAFWYKATKSWSLATTPDEQLLDASTTGASGPWFYLSRRAASAGGSKLHFAITDSAGTVHTVETAAISVPAGTWKHIAVTWSFNNYAGGNNDELNIYVDGGSATLGTLWWRTQFTSTTLTISPTIGTLYIGGTRAGFAEAGGGTTNSVDGMIDEFRAYNYAATRSAVVSIMNLNTGGCLDHYAVADSGTGLSCQLSQVTLAAHTTAHAAYTNNAKATLSTSDNTGTWTLLTGHGTLTNIGTNTGNATYQFNVESSVLLGYTHPTSATVTVHATDGTYAEQESTPIVIANCASGKFNACELTAPRCVPIAGATAYSKLFTKLANTLFKLDFVALTGTGILDNTFSNSVTVNLLANTNAPTINAANNCPTSQTDTISLGTVSFNAGQTAAAGITVAANAFSAAAKRYSAYRDVRVQFICDATNCGANAGTYCATDGFTVRPQALTVSSSANADSTGASSAATPAVKAGATFTLTADSNTAGYDGIPSIDLTRAEWPGAPSAVGTLAGSFSGGATISTGDGASGSFTFSDVGYFRLKADGVFDAAYAGVSGDIGNGDCVVDSSATTADATGRFGCNVANMATSNYFGRFIPDHFDTTVTDACVSGVFTYSGQSFPLKVTAMNAASGATANYTGGFAKTVTLSDANGAVGAFTPLSLVAGDFVNGVADKTAVPSVSFLFTSKLTAASTLKVRGTDGEASSATGSEGTTVLRSGRLRLSNAFGSEKSNLVMPVQAQYWSGNSWVLNSVDGCTSLPANAFYLLGAPAGVAASAVSLAGGSGTLTLTKPSPVATGSVDIAANLGTSGDDQSCLGSHGGTAAGRTWLRSQNGNCAATYDRDPSARATFGLYPPETRKTVHTRESY